MYGIQSLHLELQSAADKWLQSNGQSLIDSNCVYESKLKDVGKAGAWAGRGALAALCDICNVSMHLYIIMSGF